MSFQNTFGVPIIPDNETERLRALHHYQIIAADVKDSFDNIAKIMAEDFEVPIALISVVDSEEVIFKGNVGMRGVERTSRGVSLCALAIMTDELTVFENATEATCFMHNPLVQGQFGLKFYAAAPLLTREGYAIGTVCLVDKKPRSFSHKERQQLKRFAKMVMHEIELRLDANRAAVAYTKTIENQRNALSKQNKKLSIAHAELASFNNAANHDLQEPLRKIQLFSEKLQSEEASHLSNKGRTYINRIHSSAQWAQQLIEAILDYSSVATLSEVSLTPVNLNGILRYLQTSQAEKLSDQNVIITTNHLPHVEGVGEHLVLLFEQLIDNSLKFAKPDMPLQINISAELGVGIRGEFMNKPMWVISYQDNGIGFSNEFNEQIFEVFERVHLDGNYVGVGIGLAICKKIMHLHNGDIKAIGIPQVGSTFHLYFPIPSES